MLIFKFCPALSLLADLAGLADLLGLSGLAHLLGQVGLAGIFETTVMFKLV